MDDFFHKGSKVILIIPIVIVIIALFFKFNSPAKIPQAVNNLPTTMPTHPAQLTQNNSLKFDLAGPIVCQNLFIHNKKVFYKNNLDNYLLNGDCLYQWQTGKLNGVKKCGLSNYINLAENYAGMFSVSDLANNSMVASLVKDRGINVLDVLKSCKKGLIKDEAVFAVPSRVLFKIQ